MPFHAVPPEVGLLVPVTTSPQEQVLQLPALPELSITNALSAPPEARPASLDVLTSALMLHPGDSASLVAIVRDSAGGALSRRARWHSVDPRVALIDGLVLRALRPGRTTVIVSFGSLESRLDVTVRPMLRARVVDIDGAPISKASVRMRFYSREDLVTSDVTGQVALVGLDEREGLLRLDVDPTGDRALHSASLFVPSSETNEMISIVLVPTAWRIRGGRYAGMEVPVSIPHATSRRGHSFVRLHSVSPQGSEGSARIVGWPVSRLPLLIAPEASLTPTDTARFWATARELEADIGLRLFEAAAGGAQLQRAVVPLRPRAGLDAEAMTHATWSNGGEVFDAEILVRSPAILHDRRIIAHELLHVLGFGHTVSWPSIVAPAGAPGAAWLTREDVAWVQLVLRLRATQAREQAAYGLDAARARR